MIGRSTDLVVVVALSLLEVAVVLAGVDISAMRVLVGLPTALFLPGYTLAAAAFPDRSISRLERVLLSVGLSLSLAAVGGLLLNWTPSGIGAVSWSLLLGGTIVVASGVAAVRRSHGARQPGGGLKWQLQFGPASLLGMAGFMVVGAITIAAIGAARQPGVPFTQLWLLPDHRHGLADVGIENDESRPVSYRLVVSDSNGREVQDWPSIELQPGATWHDVLSLPLDSDTADLEATLYTSDSPDVVYRHVFVKPGTPQEDE